MRSIDSQSIKIFDRSNSYLLEGPDISKSLCDPNQKLSSMDRNGLRPALFDGFFCKSKFLYIWNSDLGLVYASSEGFDFLRCILVNF
jgi:hypothetical protein